MLNCLLRSYTITLTDATISSIEQAQMDNAVVDHANIPVTENVSFIYSKIEWTWVDGGVTAEDEWEAQMTR